MLKKEIRKPSNNESGCLSLTTAFFIYSYLLTHHCNQHQPIKTCHSSMQYGSLILSFEIRYVCTLQPINCPLQAWPVFSFLINTLDLDLEPSQYVTVRGCNNDCDTASCYCNIEKKPPQCATCCQERD
ncbi:hypothetical protein LWI28_013523 [Acer negundo]|uniref:Uncharacterized protein n=1 Tax=Acer negundo TaxID=4023 RepID=A0AAD5P4C0_ACENE|nr:hypothetical protein LWI28_013523 [Acer negundo]